ncbi:MAG: hypothetical protein FWF04_02435 [Clostridiales bacterium]|nr:hypothetical protein [Clostridiales bacterium]
MGLTGYGFALFIFILACLFALLCKYLFAGAKSHMLALDEKEKKLLTFYSTLEEMMDEFNDSAAQANSELARQAEEIRGIAAGLRSPQAVAAVADAHARQAPPPPMPAAQPPARPKPAPPISPAGDNGEASLYKALGVSLPRAKEATENKPAPDRHARILSMRQNGLDRMQIARELCVTLSEVDLVLGMAGRKSKVDAGG